MTDHAAVPAATAPRPRRQSTVSRRVRKGAVGALWALAGILLVMLMWELVKWVGTLVSLPFNTNDLSMPHVWTMFSGAWQPEVRGSDTTVLQAVLQSAAYSLLIALGGFIIGMFNADIPLIGRSLHDLIIEPQRASLIPGFYDVKEAAMNAGALGCSISGAGPSVFALCPNSLVAENAGLAMQQAFAKHNKTADIYLSGINQEGAIIC